MAIQNIKYSDTLAVNLYDTNPWYMFARNLDKFNLGTVVSIPQEAAYPLAKVKGAGAEAISTAITYTEKTVASKMLIVPPVYVEKKESDELTFDSRTRLIENVTLSLQEAISSEIMNAFSPGATALESITRTSGTVTRPNVYGQPAMKSLTMADIAKAKAKLIIQSRSTNPTNLYLIVDPIMYADLVQLDQFVEADSLTIQTQVNGFVGTVQGIKVIQRTSGNPYTALVAQPATLNYKDTYDATHFSGALLVDANLVGFTARTKEGARDTFVGFDNYAIGYYTDIVQGHTRVTATQIYDEVATVIQGVVAIIEQA